MKIYLVGGAVRDKLLGLPIKERDYVVVGATVADMQKLGYRHVGKEFPVFLHPKSGEEYALARMERKNAPGYKGFSFDTSQHVSLEEDLIRRDLTINAMAYDIAEEKLIDPYHGREDLEQKVLRHVSNAFAEDPVRILRVGRFLARYAHLGFHVDQNTMQLMRNMVDAGEVDALVAERVWKELERALSEPNPECFFQTLLEAGAEPILFPHFDASAIHTLKCAVSISKNTAIRFAVLMYRYGAIHSIQHKEALHQFAKRYRIPKYYRELAVLVDAHYESARQSSQFQAEALLKLFYALDIFRRESRFHDFLIAVRAIAISRGESFEQEWLLQAATVVKSLDVKLLLVPNQAPSALPTRIMTARLDLLTEWLKQKSS